MLIKAIVFDLDDTLYKEKDYVKSGLKVIDSWVKEKYKIDGFYEIAANLLNTGEKKFIFNRTLEKLNIAYDENTIKEMIEKFRSHEPDIHLIEDAEWVLNRLIDTVKIGIISDGFLIAQEKKISALKIKEKFHSIILTDRFGREYWKPSCVPYEQAREELGFLPSQYVYIGDNVNKDFITAKRLGWTTVHIDRIDGVYSNITAKLEYQAHYRINDLRQLSDIPELKHLFKNNE